MKTTKRTYSCAALLGLLMAGVALMIGCSQSQSDYVVNAPREAIQTGAGPTQEPIPMRERRCLLNNTAELTVSNQSEKTCYEVYLNDERIMLLAPSFKHTATVPAGTNILSVRVKGTDITLFKETVEMGACKAYEYILTKER